MRKRFKKWLLLAAILALSPCGAFSQSNYVAYRTVTSAAPVADIAVRLIGSGVSYHKLTWTVTGTVSACTVALDSSTNGTSWSAGSVIAGQTCTTSGTSTIASTTVNYIRINATALSGGGSVAFVYTGYVNSPGGGATGAVLLSPTGPQTINRQIVSVIPNEAEVSNINLKNTANTSNSTGQFLMFNGGGLDIQNSDANNCAVYCPGIYWNTDGSIAFWPGGQNVNPLTVTTRTGDTEGLSIFTGAVNAGTATGGADGIFNALTGFRVNNAAASGNVLRGNGTNFVSAQLNYSDLTGTAPGGLSGGSASQAMFWTSATAAGLAPTYQITSNTNGIYFGGLGGLPGTSGEIETQMPLFMQGPLSVSNGSTRQFRVLGSGLIDVYNGFTPTNGQFLIGDTSAGNMQLAVPTGTTPITVTGGAHSLVTACATCVVTTESARAVDFTSLTSLKIPNSAGAAPTTSALVAYDTTLNALTYGRNGSTSYATIALTALGASDTCTAACTFATTVSIPASLKLGSTFDFFARGVATTGVTGSPLLAFQVNMGGTTNVLSNSNNLSPGASMTNAEWVVKAQCVITAVGNPGTVICGEGQEYIISNTSTGSASSRYFVTNPTGANYITTSAQTLSIQETGVMVALESVTLQWIRVELRP